eukprot:9941094-Ditylum_brightwellii.AAC.1
MTMCTPAEALLGTGCCTMARMVNQIHEIKVIAKKDSCSMLDAKTLKKLHDLAEEALQIILTSFGPNQGNRGSNKYTSSRLVYTCYDNNASANQTAL